MPDDLKSQIAAARVAGYSDKEISDHLATLPQFKGYSSDEISNYLTTSVPRDVDPQRGATAATSIGPHTWRDTLKEYALKGAEWLPAIGGTVGGIAGGGPTPSGVAGAAAGGAAGKAGQRLIETAVYGKEPTGQTPGQALKEIGVSGGEQAVAQAVGAGINKAVPVGGALDRWAARPVSRMLRQALPPTATDEVYPGMVLAKEPGLPMMTGRYGMKNFIRGRIDQLNRDLAQTSSKLTQAGRTVDLQRPIANALTELDKVPQEYDLSALSGKLANLEDTIATKRVPTGQFTTTSTGRRIPVFQTTPGGVGQPPQTVYMPRGLDQMTIDQAIQYRRELMKLGKNSSGAVKDAISRIYSDVTDAIHQEAPELEPLDSRIHNLIYAHDAMQARVSHLETGMVERTAGHAPEEAVERKVLRLSPALTRSVPYSVAKAKFYRSIISGNAVKNILRYGVIGRSPMTPPPDEQDQE